MPGAIPKIVPRKKALKLTLEAPASKLTTEYGAIGKLRTTATESIPGSASFSPKCLSLLPETL